MSKWSHAGPWTLTMEAWPLKMEPLSVCRQVVADSHHFDEEQNPDADPPLKVPKREIFHRSDFPDFYTIKSSWVGDLVVKILTYYFNF